MDMGTDAAAEREKNGRRCTVMTADTTAANSKLVLNNA